MFDVPYVRVVVDKDMTSAAGLTVMAHEIAVLRAMYGESAVRQVPYDPMGGREQRTIHPGPEWDRLTNRWGANPESNQPWVVHAFGTRAGFEQQIPAWCALDPMRQGLTVAADAADATPVAPVTAAEVEARLSAERKSLGATLTNQDDELARVRAELAAAEAKLAALNAGIDQAQAEADGDDGEQRLREPAEMTKEQIAAELTRLGVEHDGRASKAALAGLLSEVREQG